ncbi:MAG: winged helix DNA-binding protein [Burkholderiaceae bacterium]
MARKGIGAGERAPAASALGTAPVARGIVSSAHLVSERTPELSELEFGIIICWNAYSRWAVRCMAAAGLADLTITDVNVLHHVNHRGRKKKLADLCLIQNVEDTHVISYSLKKLMHLGVVESERLGKEVLYSVTADGRAVVARYREIRERCLIDGLVPDAGLNTDIGELARLLRRLSGNYDQAARAAASL